MKSPQTIIITGASSGIGKALALEYADTDIKLGLIARHKDRLNEVAQQCQAKGAVVSVLAEDVTNFASVEKWMLAYDGEHSVDLVISNAGISGGTGNEKDIESLKDIKKIFKTNVFAAISTGQILFDRMKQRKRGQIAFTGSIAGFQGWSGAPAYTSSKSALHTYVEGLRLIAAPLNIGVSVIAPGFVKSSMTDQNNFPMPFKISAKNAAQRIKRGISHNKRYIIFPKRMYAISLISRLIPEVILLYVANKIAAKK